MDDDEKVIDRKISEIDGMLDRVIEKLDKILGITTTATTEQSSGSKHKNSFYRAREQRTRGGGVDDASIKDVQQLVQSVKKNSETLVDNVNNIKDNLTKENESYKKELITTEIRQRVEDIREREKQRKRRKSSVRDPNCWQRPECRKKDSLRQPKGVIAGRVLTCAGGKNVLLQIQRLAIKTNHKRQQYVTTLWDAGSTISFITFRRATELNLHVTKEVFLEIENIGESKQGFKSKVYQLELIDENGKIEIIHVLGIEKILTNVKGINYNEVYAKFTGIQNGQIESPDKGEVHCLIGYDYAGLHPVRKRVCGHLLILENTFGTIVAGLSSVGNFV